MPADGPAATPMPDVLSHGRPAHLCQARSPDRPVRHRHLRSRPCHTPQRAPLEPATIVEPSSLRDLLGAPAVPPHPTSRPDPTRLRMRLAHPRDPVVRPGAVEHHHRWAQPRHSIRNPLGEQLVPASRRQSCRASRGTYSNGNPNWATTPTACDSDRKCGAKSGSARRAYAISRVR